MRWGNTKGTHHFVFGACAASPTFCSVRDEPALGPRPSREGSAGRVGVLARTRPEPCEAALLQEEPVVFLPGADRYPAEDGGPERTGDAPRPQDTALLLPLLSLLSLAETHSKRNCPARNPRSPCVLDGVGPVAADLHRPTGLQLALRRMWPRLESWEGCPSGLWKQVLTRVGRSLDDEIRELK